MSTDLVADFEQANSPSAGWWLGFALVASAMAVFAVAADQNVALIFVAALFWFVVPLARSTRPAAGQSVRPSRTELLDLRAEALVVLLLMWGWALIRWLAALVVGLWVIPVAAIAWIVLKSGVRAGPATAKDELAAVALVVGAAAAAMLHAFCEGISAGGNGRHARTGVRPLALRLVEVICWSGRVVTPPCVGMWRYPVRTIARLYPVLLSAVLVGVVWAIQPVMADGDAFAEVAKLGIDRDQLAIGFAIGGIIALDIDGWLRRACGGTRAAAVLVLGEHLILWAVFLLGDELARGDLGSPAEAVGYLVGASIGVAISMLLGLAQATAAGMTVSARCRRRKHDRAPEWFPRVQQAGIAVGAQMVHGRALGG